MENWNGKPYHSFDYMLKERFGEKIYKVALNGGMTCPNRDGTLGSRGCIFCSAGGSGDFAGNRQDSITQQIEKQASSIRQKRGVAKFIAYFQAYTNTYAPVDYLRKIYTEAISHPDIVAVSIGTRPDCLDKDILQLLDELNQKKPVWVELGLQTIHETTAQYIRRGYPLSCFEQAVSELRKRNLDVIVHTILGLPGENRNDILSTIEYLNHQDIQGIKLQLLHVLKGTDLADDYLAGKFQVYTMEEYLDLVIDCLEHLNPEIVIHRLTGDGPKDLLIAPLWSSAKRTVLNTLHRKCKLQHSFQGKKYKPIENKED
jgi:radical SAM protein (TIGR01212 family)